ncbi:MAG: hypothetical protein U1F41_01060 [Burkholderiales bacterium]
MSDVFTPEQTLVLARWARGRFGLEPPPDALADGMLALIHDALTELDDDARKAAIDTLAAMKTVSPAVRKQLLALLRASAPFAWLRKHQPADADLVSVDDWLDRETVATQDELLRCAMREIFDSGTDSDRKTIEESFARYRATLGLPPTDPTPQEPAMNVNFVIDPRALPKEFRANLGLPALPDPLPPAEDKEALEKYVADVSELLKPLEIAPPRTEIQQTRFGFIIGTLLNRELFAPKAAGVMAAIEDAEDLCRGYSNDLQGKPQPNTDHLTKLLAIIAKSRHSATVSFQEFAYVGKYALDNVRAVPPGSSDEYLKRQVDIALDQYVSGAGPIESIELPSLTSEAVPLEVEPSNIEVVATIYPALQLERMRLFDVVDRITELYMNGLLPIGGDATGVELDDYHWSAEDRLSAPQRYSVYSRVLGAAGGEVSKEVQPNKQFDMCLIRFVSSLAEYDRRRSVADLIQTTQISSLSTEQVRKSGRELAANASLYGWGGAYSAARRLRDHIVRALKILSLPQIQKVYGVSSPYQVIERVALNEFGQAPNIVKYRTMAEAGKTILRLVAKYASAWNTNTQKPLFATPLNRNADIPDTDAQTLIMEAQNWLAVNGIANEQVDKMSQPSDSLFAPSMPAFGGNASSKPAAASPDVMSKLQQMVASGQTPTLDQIKSMLPAMGA